jgi:hypothetical protein
MGIIAEGPPAPLSVMISFTKADPYFLAELKQRCAKKADGGPKKNRGSYSCCNLRKAFAQEPPRALAPDVRKPRAP